MDEKHKKILVVVCCVVCVVVAVIVIPRTFRTERTYGISDVPDEIVVVKCCDADCGVEYEIGLRDYLTMTKGEGIDTRPGICEKCGRRTILKAMRCASCDKVFIEGSVRGDLPDRCPHCNFSTRASRSMSQ